MGKSRRPPRPTTVCRVDPCLIAAIPEKLDHVIERQGQMLAGMAAAQTCAEGQRETVGRHETILGGNGTPGLVRTVERHDSVLAEMAMQTTLRTSIWTAGMVAFATLLSALFAWLFR